MTSKYVFQSFNQRYSALRYRGASNYYAHSCQRHLIQYKKNFYLLYWWFREPLLKPVTINDNEHFLFVNPRNKKSFLGFATVGLNGSLAIKLIKTKKKHFSKALIKLQSTFHKKGYSLFRCFLFLFMFWLA